LPFLFSFFLFRRLRTTQNPTNLTQS
jgi:hypothetical protein